MKCKLLILLLALLLPVIALADTHTVENDDLLLTIDDTNLYMTVTDKASGKSFASSIEPASGKLTGWKAFVASPLVLDVVDGQSVITKQQSLMGNQVAIDLTMLEDGADALVDFTALGVKIKLQIRLEADSIAITMPKDGLEEYPVSKGVGKDGVETFTDTRVCGVYLLPCFGATELDEKAGYMLVPEAAGALINFSNGEGVGSTPFSKRIYGTNIGVDKSVMTELNRPAEQITLPVYGMAYTDDQLGYLAVVENGSEAADIMAYPAGVITDYNWAAAHFTLREQYIAQTTRTLGLNSRESKPYLRDMTVRFYILSGESASYTGMAQRYRKALLDNGQLNTADTAYRPRVDFLGAESAAFLLWNSVEPMTSVEQMEEILAACDESGINDPLVIYRGWQPGGLTWALGSGSVELERKLGKEDDLIALARSVRENGGKFMLEIDPVQANPDRMYNMRVDVVRTIGQTIAEYQTGKELYPNLYYLTPSRSAEIMKAMADKWGEHVDGLAVVKLPNTLYSYYSRGSNHSRGETLTDYQTLLANTDAALALQNPLSDYLAQTDVFLDMPLDTTSYSFLSAEVPFLPMVLSGQIPYYSTWLNFESNQQKALLKLVEYGAYPSWLLTAEDVQPLIHTNSSDVFSAKWNVLLPTMTEINEKLQDLHESIGGSAMVKHEQIVTDVVKVSYENGTQVYINYRKADIPVDGVIIPALGYLVKGGDAQ
ncbi:MAG: hypothetical protein IJA77_04040 [Clostridia bacterium]|nr:hypothetical protein [Clostridia bacterium]MBQ3484657.1 hypothetical protein [Clostridia bacterium]